MGWSCGVRAAWVRDAWTKACFDQSGTQNNFEANGKRYFYEIANTEHSDGAITGTVWMIFDHPTLGERCKRVSTFRINGDGTVKRAPKFLKDATPAIEEINRRYDQTYGSGRIRPGSNSLSFAEAGEMART